ncbi:MAG: hypothetical protein HKN87_06995, partial [Saprospiraceae bacterium]|nr:hypothetical protein [Saprospiraceae bacterium]
MDQTLPSKSRAFIVFFILLASTAMYNSYGQCIYTTLNPTTGCTANVPALAVDLTSDPEAVWTSCNISRGSKFDTCCGTQLHNNDRCIEFQLTLHPEAVGIIFEVPTGAIPSILYYRIDCGPDQLAGEPICVNNTGGIVTIDFCEPGNNPNTYRITSVAGFAQGPAEVTVSGCNAQLQVTGEYHLPSMTWDAVDINGNPVTPASLKNYYESFLSCTSGCDNPTATVPFDPSLPDTIYYEVCADVTSSCSGIFDPVCTIAKLAILQPPEIIIPDYNFCPDDPYTVTVTPLDPMGNYEYTFYDATGGAGAVVCAQSSSASCTYSTPGAKSVEVLDLDLVAYGACAYSIMNFNIGLYVEPVASINGPPFICYDVGYDFTADDAGTGSNTIYTWDFGAGASPSTYTNTGNSGRNPPDVSYSTCGDKMIILTVVSPDLCIDQDTLIIQGDEDPPVVPANCLPSPTVECGGTTMNDAAILAWHLNNIALLEDLNGCVSDDCPWVVTHDYMPGNFNNGGCGAGSNTGSITVTYTVDDGCGSPATISATFTIEDTTPPMINDPDLEDMSFDCVLSIPAPLANAILEDSCGDNTTLTYIGDSPSGDPCLGFVITRTYELEDVCGNVTTYQQLFTLNDDQDPVIVCPNPITVEACGAEDLATHTGLAYSPSSTVISENTFNNLPPGNQSVSDNCGIETIEYSDVQTGTCPAAFVRTFIATDSCGNTATCTQNITITDLTPPTVDCDAAENLEMQCGDDYQALITQWIIDTENDILSSVGTMDPCGDVLTVTDDWDGTSVPDVSCDLSTGMTVNFTVADSCGNGVICPLLVIIYDDIPPNVNCSAYPGATAECYQDLRDIIVADSILLASGTNVSDNCDTDFSITISAIPAFDNCPQNNIQITYTVIDACNNSSTCTITYNIANADPVPTCDGGTSFECYNDLIDEVSADSLFLLNPSNVVTACDMSYTVSVSPIPSLTNCPVDVTVTFTITDSCGRTGSCDVTYTFTQVAPTINCPGLVQVEGCGAEDLLTATGLVYSTSQVPITVSTFLGLSPGSPSVGDNCGIDSLYYYDVQTGTCPAQFDRTFVVVDSCGNSDQCTQSIIIEDNTPPTVNCVVSDLYLDCSADIQAEISTWITNTQADILASIGTTDPCGDNLDIGNDWDPANVPVLNSCDPMNGGILITFTVTDSCGNPATCDGSVFLQDTVAPTINCAAIPGGTFECYDLLLAQIYADSLSVTNEISGIASDDCWDDFSVSISPIPALDNCPNPLIQLTYTITDPCGNFVTCVVDYAIDNAGPVIDACPSDATVECYSDMVAQITADSLALSAGGVTSACGMSYVVTRSALPAFDNCPNSYSITWTVTDSCNRFTTCVTTYTIANADPVIDACPSDATVECYSDLLTQISIDSLALSNGGVTTACGMNYSLIRSALPNFDNCPNSYTITWTVTDSCSRSTTCATTYTIANADPVIDACPSDATVECYSDLLTQISIDSLALSMGGVTTACGMNYSLTRSPLPAFDNCPNTYTITWTVTDSCGRSIDCTTDYTIDNAGPVVDFCPLGGTVECYSDLVAIVRIDSTILSGFGVTSACGMSYVVTRSPLPAFDNCPNTYTITWTVTDSCGRSIDCTTDYTIDNAGPVIDVCPADATVACYSDMVSQITAESLALSGGGVTSACGMSYVVTRSPLPAFDNCPNTYTITWTVTDSCGRSIDCTTDYTIDNAGPVIDVCPADATVACFSDMVAQITADSLALSGGGVTSACGMSYVVTRSAIPALDNCPNTYTITWTVTDSCGRSIDCTTDYTIDNGGPVIDVCPADATVACFSDMVAQISADSLALSGGGVTSACGMSYVVTRSALPAFDNCPNTYTITWTVTDSCGRAIDCT